MSTTIQSTIDDLRAKRTFHEGEAARYATAIKVLEGLSLPATPAKARHPAPVAPKQPLKRGPYQPTLRADTLFPKGVHVRLKDSAAKRVGFGVGGHQVSETPVYGTVVGYPRTKPSRMYVRVIGKKAGRLFSAHDWETISSTELDRITSPQTALAGGAMVP